MAEVEWVPEELEEAAARLIPPMKRDGGKRIGVVTYANLTASRSFTWNERFSIPEVLFYPGHIDLQGMFCLIGGSTILLHAYCEINIYESEAYSAMVLATTSTLTNLVRSSLKVEVATVGENLGWTTSVLEMTSLYEGLRRRCLRRRTTHGLGYEAKISKCDPAVPLNKN
ncbi:hypothetical protein BJV74DRAFT_795460 [Russula compacta]|nr:hypothetical protein BJV74DRAFT_795460 [Russula compacta]